MNTETELELDLQIACDATTLPTEAQFVLWAKTAIQGRLDEAELSIRLVDEVESAELNMQYRQKSGPTNVLSFPADLPPELELPLLGDLAICKQVVEREANEQHKACLDHWAHMVIHGTLHLLGYDHIADDEAEEMEALEIALLKTLNISNPYTPIL
ncbi:rRNA maturation RNase YbeY [Zhongshania aliphaticivorans]|uniref:rRNA maturation RNase YbeY n=1 Tax=Zhongshania aliphaticivorans TaxID=1470434 RepID=UPI0012E4732F|nr:rRNA maturation RNase YbeY [Zhongshania aliphaticivorans]CAA0095625.1 Endoribonuclease YbeY [Zhongshania aliphaticivorans]